MIRIAAVLVLFLSSVSLFAQDPGVRFVTELRPTRYLVRSEISFTVAVPRPGAVVELDVPGEILSVHSDCLRSSPVRCTVSPSTDFVWVSTKVDAAGTYTATTRLITPSGTDPANDRDTWTIEVVDAPSLSVAARSYRYDPGTAADVSVSFYNFGGVARDVVLTMTLPEDGTFTGRPAEECEVAAKSIVCRYEELPDLTARYLTVQVVTPDRLEGGTVPFEVSIAASAADFDPEDDRAAAVIDVLRNLVVDNTNDEGAGSLRQALLDTQQFCAAAPLCRIVFRIPGAGEEGRFVIRPRSELPPVQGNVAIDGATQTRFAGDTNPDGPEVVIDGSQAPPARGLILGGPSCEMYVTDLAIVNFDGPGLEAYRGPFHYTDCRYFLFPNTVVSGSRFTGNYRGIAVTGPGYVTIRDNVISGNVRAGVFANGSWRVDIVRNRITGNGASGIFLNPDNPNLFQGAIVEENVISGNAEWGIARTFTGDARIRRNSIFGNRYLAVDAGLDFETPNAARDDAWSTNIPNKPMLLSAHYDAATGKTRVHGRLDSETHAGVSTFAIDFYASDSLSGAGQAEMAQWLAVHVLPANGGHASFSVDLEGDFRGRSITATNTRWHIVGWDESVHDTSEPGNALIVH